MSNPISKTDPKKVVITKNPKDQRSEFSKSKFLNSQCFTEVMSRDQFVDSIGSQWQQYKQISIFTISQTIQILHNGKGKVVKNHAESKNTKLFTKVEKSYLINSDTNFLQHLGVTTGQGQVRATMQGKYRQINKFVEIIQATIVKSDLDNLSIYDFGCGKGYLTMALHHHLTHDKQTVIKTTGIDLKAKVIKQNRQVAKLCGYESLHFINGDISDIKMDKHGMLIALHACDIATDIAIHKAIISHAKYIIVSPCCHKQVRRSMQAQPLTSSITQHGILLERQAEILTDTIRSLILEEYGYRTDIFEFVSTEHTSKNLMIRAVYTGNKKDNRNKIYQLMQTFGLSKQQYLDNLLSSND